MADPPHQPGRKDAAADESAGPGRAQKAEGGGREPLVLAAQRHEQAEQARGGEQERRAPGQRENGTIGDEHSGDRSGTFGAGRGSGKIAPPALGVQGRRNSASAAERVLSFAASSALSRSISAASIAIRASSS